MLRKDKPMIVAFLTPAVLCYVLVFLYPTIRTFIMSFFAVESVSDSVSKWRFYGFGNYIKLFTTPIFLQSMKNIGRIWFFGGAGVMFLSLLFAVILTSGVKGKTFFRSVIYLPNVVSAVAMGTMWINYVYNSDYGLLHTFFNAVGLTGLSQTLWTSPGNLFWSMLVAYSFGMVGYHMLIFMSGIEQIPNDYYEAALIEGANIFKRFTSITLPFLRGVLRTNIVMWTVYTVGFFVWGQLFSPVNLSNDTVAPMNYMYELVFGSSSSAATARNSGAGAAIGVIMCLIVVAVFFATNRIVKNDDIEL
ncbi:carbohydrate ABC transporter permease [Treponema brennaborense]|uniref:ABC-type transporter, integral membrane subunit n=1 Tax=Treponema brennaborense (strain DSM 12168 / CIP 105900 / DD5/3) TaxID=906968 RepID=F4LP10_TREBD|nr:sugar ABC transporter permease [Treponema brennaborense]AEE17987.1 ABC-type transporter, integral membrane subunit [Treponema brennaborense DSM 12168]